MTHSNRIHSLQTPTKEVCVRIGLFFCFDVTNDADDVTRDANDADSAFHRQLRSLFRRTILRFIISGVTLNVSVTCAACDAISLKHAMLTV